MTVNVNEIFVLANPSLTPTKIIAEPNWFVSDVSVTVRFVPLPPNTMCAASIKLVFELDADNTSDDAAVSASLITKPMGPIGLSSGVTILVIPEIVGGEFTVDTATAVLFAGLGSGELDETVALLVHFPAVVPFA